MTLQTLIWLALGAALAPLLRRALAAQLGNLQAIGGSAAGAAIAGALVSLIAQRDHPGPIDPLAMAVAAIGAALFLILLSRLPDEPAEPRPQKRPLSR